jgi:hypothetical protein
VAAWRARVAAVAGAAVSEYTARIHEYADCAVGVVPAAGGIAAAGAWAQVQVQAQAQAPAAPARPTGPSPAVQSWAPSAGSKLAAADAAAQVPGFRKSAAGSPAAARSDQWEPNSDGTIPTVASV